ncbi:hypothetical protein ACYF6T_23400 [Streptomyces sp. 7R007]
MLATAFVVALASGAAGPLDVGWDSPTGTTHTSAADVGWNVTAGDVGWAVVAADNPSDVGWDSTSDVGWTAPAGAEA